MPPQNASLALGPVRDVMRSVDRHRALWLTALGTGLRQGELLALRWDDVDLEANRLTVRHTLANVAGILTLLEPKTNRSRRTRDAGRSRPVSPAGSPDPAAHGAPGGRVALDRDRATCSRRCSGRRSTRRPSRAASRTRSTGRGCPAPLPRPAPLAATFLLAQGMTLEDVKNQLGHLVDRADLEHLRACARAAAAGGGAGDGRGAGRVIEGGPGALC